MFFKHSVNSEISSDRTIPIFLIRSNCLLYQQEISKLKVNVKLIICYSQKRGGNIYIDYNYV